MLEAALAAEPSDVRLLVQVAYVSRALGDNERAIEALHVATQLSPTSVPAFIDYGAALAAAGRKKEAIAAFRFALKHDPRASPALLGLARALLPENPEAALPLLQRLVALDPGFPGVEDALAEARAGRAAAPSSFRLVRTDDRATAEEVARALAAGSALPAAAAATPEVPLDSIDEPARAAAARLSPGQVSEVVPTPAGFVVVKRER